jgi:hypothetical protein
MVSIEDGQVCCRYQGSQRQRWHTMTLPAQELSRRFLQHVFPQGCHKVRYYGLWNPRQRPPLHPLQLWLARHAAAPLPPPRTQRARRPPSGVHPSELARRVLTAARACWS